MAPPARLDIHTASGCRSISVPAKQSNRLLTDILRQSDLPLNTRCGQRGLCDGCLVELLDGRLIDLSSREPASATIQPVPLRGCQFLLPTHGRVEIRVPARSLLTHQPQIVTSFRVLVPRAHDPLSQSAETCNLPAFGAAIDVGTTTVVVLLVELATGEIVAEASALNAQADLGDNVLTRINLCMTDKAMVGQLQQAVIRRTIGSLIARVLTQAAVSADQLACMTVAGNSTMLHLLDGVDPTSMGLAPFTPTFLEHRVISARGLPWREASGAGETSTAEVASSDDAVTLRYEPGANDPAIHLLPSAAAYVGADVVAGIFSTGIAYSADTCMLVDVGTNGEIVLKHADRLLACATAAGPAFEGSGLTWGVRAGEGAIDHVTLRQGPSHLDVDVIGSAKPKGMCGTAYVDVIAQARKLGLIGPTGRFIQKAVDTWPVEQLQHGWGLTVAHGVGDEPIQVTEGDIASLLQAKAAIAAGIICLLERVNLRSEDVTTLFLAGGFGFHMNVKHAIDLGLLPGFRSSQVQLVGNSSLAGAYVSLLDSGALSEITRVAAAIEIVELNLEPQFESRYIDQLMI